MATHSYKERIVRQDGQPTQIYRERVTNNQDPSYKTQTSYTGRSLLYTLLNIVEGLLAIRFLLRFLAANPNNAFVNFIYDITAPLVAPFRNIFAPLVTDGSVLEWSTLVAMLVYAVVGGLIISAISAASRRSTV
jgi:uncharacterized protein YggT (Ycf19 family)